MKQTKRAVSIVLVLMMIVSMFAVNVTQASAADPQTAPLLGDVNRDNHVTIRDAQALQRSLAGQVFKGRVDYKPYNNGTLPLTDVDFKVANTYKPESHNHDKLVNIMDATYIQLYLAGDNRGKGKGINESIDLEPEPVTEAPATEPATQAPATQAPATQAPATQAPATQAPATQTPTDAPADKTIVTVKGLDGKTMTEEFNVGDTFTVYTTLYADVPNNAIVAVQGTQYYDPALLECADEWDDSGEFGEFVELDDMFPIVSRNSSLVANRLSGETHFNATTTAATANRAFRFSSADSLLIKTQYKALQPGEVTVYTTLRMLTALNNGNLVDLGVDRPENGSYVLHMSFYPTGAEEPTQVPATQAPATQAPATQAPATQAPATQAPATQAPATQAPATQAPATQAPATQAPATQAPATQAPATQAPATQAPATQAPATQAPDLSGYYLVGSMNSWQPAAAYKLTKNTAASAEEYVLNSTALKTTDQFKIAYSADGTTIADGGWYPSGVDNDYGLNGEITANGTYDIYFRPNYDGDADWFASCIYVDGMPAPATEAPATQAPATQASTDAPAGKAVVTVKGLDGKTMTEEFNVGDTFTVYTTLYADVPNNAIVAVQGTQYYDPALLECADEWDDSGEFGEFVELEDMFPILSKNSSLLANRLSGETHFNATTTAATANRAFRFSSADSLLIKTQYKALQPGEVTVYTTLRMLTALNNGNLVDLGVDRPENGSYVLHMSFYPTGAEEPTQVPATQAPATQAPATQAPATQAPATQAPATQAPATQAPATQAPATQAPATQAPATQAPATQAPATQAPATQAPATQAPATQASTTAPTQAPTGPKVIVTVQGMDGESETKEFVVNETFTVYTTLSVNVAGDDDNAVVAIQGSQKSNNTAFRCVNNWVKSGDSGEFTDAADMFPNLTNLVATLSSGRQIAFEASAPNSTDVFRFPDDTLLIKTQYKVNRSVKGTITTELGSLTVSRPTAAGGRESVDLRSGGTDYPENGSYVLHMSFYPPGVQPTEAPATEAPATVAPATQAPATQAPATQAPDLSGYYLIGSMNNWQPAAAYKLTANTGASTEEYVLNSTALKTTDQFKIAYSADGTTIADGRWYPSGTGANYGQNGEITANGTYDIYFRPNYDGDADWFANCIYVAGMPAPATEAPATQAPATEAPATEAPATQAPATQAPATQASTDAPAGKTVVTVKGLDGKTMTEEFNVGDTFTVYTTLYTDVADNAIVAVQGAQNYDPALLECADEWDDSGEFGEFVELDDMFPILSKNSSLLANRLSGETHFNATTTAATANRAFRFPSADSLLIKTQYKALQPGEVTVYTTLRMLTALNNGNLVDLGVDRPENGTYVLHMSFYPTGAEEPTQAPATQAPATQAPATQAPATQAPATQAPATQAPATQAPATEAPVSTTSFLLTDNFGWGAAYVYAWDDDGNELNGEWPGTSQAQTQTNEYGETQFVCNVPAGAVGVVLSNGNGAQTEDITDFSYDGYWMDGSKNELGHYKVTGWKSDPTPTTAPATETPVSTTSFLLTDNFGWGTAYVYAWDDDGNELNGEWPGASQAQTQTNEYGETQFVCNVPAGATGVILSNGNGAQTEDITDFSYDGYWMDGTKNELGHYKVTGWNSSDPTPTTAPATQAPATQAPTTASVADGYYLVGSFSDWKAETGYLFTENSANPGEYMLSTTLTQGSMLKVAKSEGGVISDDNWFPGGTDNEYTVDAAHAGAVTIYFKTTYQADWSAFGGYIYIDNGSTPEPTTAPATQAPVSTTSFLLTDNFGWGTAYVYAWDDDGNELNGEWPGASQAQTQTNEYGETQFVCNVPAGATGVILSNGNGAQTEDITDFSYDGYWMDGTKNELGHYKVTGWNSSDPTPTTAPTTAPATEAPATEASKNYVYLAPGPWETANARFELYVWGNGEAWLSATKVGSTYRFEIPDGYTGGIFVREDPAKSAGSWDAKWNQTGDLTLTGNIGKTYTVTGWGSNDGYWS